jgi:hypothetical protein
MLLRVRPKLVLPKRQQAVVDHFADCAKDRARYAAVVETELRAMPRFSNLDVTAVALKAVRITHRRR